MLHICNLYSKKNAFFARFWAYVGQPHGHIGWATSMPFASINSTNPRTNPWSFHKKYWELAILKNVFFLSRPFWFFFAFFPSKQVKNYGLARMGQNFEQAKCDNTFWPRPNILKGSVDSWNFQQMLDLGFSETSQNFSWGCEVSVNPKSRICWKFQLSISKTVGYADLEEVNISNLASPFINKNSKFVFILLLTWHLILRLLVDMTLIV
jgi:hypothetical protein